MGVVTLKLRVSVSSRQVLLHTGFHRSKHTDWPRTRKLVIEESKVTLLDATGTGIEGVVVLPRDFDANNKGCK